MPTSEDDNSCPTDDDLYKAQVFAHRQNDGLAQKIVRPMFLIPAAMVVSASIVGGSFYLASKVDKKYPIPNCLDGSHSDISKCVGQADEIVFQAATEKTKIVSMGAKIGIGGMFAGLVGAYFLGSGRRSRKQLDDGLNESIDGYLNRGRGFADKDKSRIRVIHNDKP